MDYLPELAHNGHNWTTYASSVLCAISDEGLMGFLVGSERRPTHPAELIGRGEGWTPQTDDEREEVTAWRAADQLWTQRNAMVNYTIVCSIPDTIFGSMLHLKSPLEKWSYLENCFGRIPRPDSWLAAEQAMQQHDTPSEQEIARGTGQEARDSNSKIKTLPGSQNEPTDSPSDCAETEAGHTKPEPKVVDARHLKPYLRGVEVEAIDLKQPAEGMDTLEAPDSGSQCASDKAEEEDDLPMSSDALETPGDLPFTSSECAETRTGHTKPEDEVADTRHVVDVLPMFEVGSIGQAWYGKHAKELQAPNEGGQHADNKVERSRDLPKSSSEVCKPVGHPTGQAGERAMEDALWTSIKDSQCAGTNSEMIANVPDPPGTPTKLSTLQVEHSRLRNSPSARAHSAMSMETNLSCTGRSSKRRETKRLELDCKQALGRPKRTYRGRTTSETPPDEAWGMGVYSSARVGWGDSTTTGSIMMTLEIRGLSARTVELRAHLPHWDTTRKEPDKAGDTGGRGDDTASKDFVDLRGVEKTLLAISRSQQGKQEVKRQDGLPVPPETPPNGYMHPPGTIRDLHPRGGMKTRAEKVRRARWIKVRGHTHRHDHIHGSLATSKANEVSQHLQNVANTYQRQGVPPKSIRSTGRLMNGHAAAWQPQIPPTSAYYGNNASKGLQHRARLRSNAENKLRQAKRSMAVRNQPTWDNLPSKGDNGGRRHGDAIRSGYADSRRVEESPLTDNGGQHSEYEAKRPRHSPAPPARSPNSILDMPTLFTDLRRCGRLKSKAENVSDTHTRQSAYLTQTALKRPLPLLPTHSNRSLDATRGSRTTNVRCNGVRHAWKVKTRGRTYWIARILMWLLQPFSMPSKRLRHPMGGLWIMKIGCSEAGSTRETETRGHTHRIAGILMWLQQILSNPSRRFQNIANTYWWEGVPPGSTRNDAKRPRNLRTAKWLPCSSGRRQDDRRTGIYSPAPSKRPPNDLTCAPSTLRNLRRRATIKTRSKNVSTIETRGSKASGLTIPIPPPRELAKLLWNVANTYWRHGIPLDERETSKLYCYSIRRPSGNGTRQDDARTRRAFRKRKLPQRNDASTQPHVHSLHTRTRSSLAAEYTLVY
ncbi:hypothetical protein F5141DRAFT_1221044 [Pisolithus sp. B1]|nr:hypothetical protein F5141DRAFT_1221044 [Pisolithus sp. B1]